MKKILLFCAISFILTGAGIALIAKQYSNTQYIDQEGASVIYFRDPEFINIAANQQFIFRQEIKASQNNLGKTILYIKNQNPINLTVSIFDSELQSPLRSDKISTRITGSATVLEWVFEPIADSAHKTYIYQIQGTTGEHVLSFHTIGPDRYDGGRLTLNGQTDDAHRLVLDWQYSTSNAWQVLMRRLTYAKPGIFNHAGTWQVLIASTLLINALCIVLCLAAFFRKDNPEI